MIEALAELAAIPQWVAYTATTKVPIGRGGRPASVSDPSTWDTLDGAKQTRAEHGLAGVGFVFRKGGGIVGVDLDNAITEEGVVKDWAHDIVREFNSYTEVSPSGRGLHIIVRGELPPGRRSRRLNDGKVEVYDGARYFTMTGHHIPAMPRNIKQCSFLSKWHSEMFAESSSPSTEIEFVEVEVDDWIQDAIGSIPSDDYEVWTTVGMALKSHFGDTGLSLWNDWSKSASNYAGEQAIARKWDSFRGDGIGLGTLVMYAKENGFTPPPREILNVLPNVDWEGWGMSLTIGPITAPDLATEGRRERRWYSFADVAREVADEWEPEPDLVSPGVLGAGDFMLLFGPPKSMKSMVLLDWCRHWCQGLDWHGLQPARPLRIAYCQMENKLDQMRRRIRDMQIDPHELDALQGRCYFTDRFHADLKKPEALTDLASSIKDNFDEPVDVLMIDPLANIFTGDNENDNNQMMTFIHRVQYLRGLVGHDTALVMVHHTNKTGRQSRAADPFTSIRGASSLRGSYDTGVYLDRTSDDEFTEIMVRYELRNGPPMPGARMTYENGRFVTAPELTEVNASAIEEFEELQKVTRVVREAAESGNPLTQSACEQRKIVPGVRNKLKNWIAEGRFELRDKPGGKGAFVVPSGWSDESGEW